MSQSPTATTSGFDTPARERLLRFLGARGGAKDDDVLALTPDASAREYFRFPWKKKTAVAAVYPGPFDPNFHPYLDVTRLFLEARLPVPEIYEVEAAQGIIVQEDLGDRQLRLVYESAAEEEVEAFKEQAITLIAQIQAATPLASERKSIAGRLAFDEAKLAWELGFFFEHYFGSLRRERLSHGEAAEVKVEMNDVAAELSARPRVLCHRDFHPSNLMVDKKRRLRIFDHQDA